MSIVTDNHIFIVSICMGKSSGIPVNLASFLWGSYMAWEINTGVCPRLEFDNIMLFNCLGYDFYIYGAFEFLHKSIANL